jgi:hypothetical protein
VGVTLGAAVFVGALAALIAGVGLVAGGLVGAVVGVGASLIVAGLGGLASAFVLEQRPDRPRR